MKTSRATIIAVLAILPSVAIAFQQPAALRYNSVVRTQDMSCHEMMEDSARV